MTPRVPSSRRPRGFALAVVVMLLAIASIILVFVIDRQTTQAMNVKRELDSYTFHHVSRGIQEAVEAWIRSNGNNPVRTALDEESRAFDLVVDSGQVVHIYFRDAQDTVLADFSGHAGETLDMGLDILMELRRNEGERAPEFVRREGPIAISVNAAPEEVLKAVIGSILDPLQTASLARELREIRANAWIDRPELDEAFKRAETPAAHIPKLQGLLAVEPVLWQVIAEAEAPRNVYPPPPTIRYGGLAIVTPVNQGRNKSAALQRSSSMISWENLSDRQ
jgi:hypothetical protein